MLLKLATSLFGSSNDRTLKKLAGYVDPINALEAEYEKLDDAALREKTDSFKFRLQQGEGLDDILHEAFATVREAAKRTLGQRHYDVQLIGGVALHKGMIAEMRTGEGKTLVATLAAYLNALEGKGVHVVTVNDYLAERDSQWMGQVYEFLGLSVGCILGNMEDDARKAAYAADITYGTNNEFGFDYLRDNMKFSLEEMVQRPFNFAIIDEVDSILIDEARTPLIISGPAEQATELYTDIDKIIPHIAAEDYDLDEKHKTVSLNEEGTEKVETLLQDAGLLTEGSLYDMANISLVHHVNQALRAHKLFELDRDYIVKDGKVIIIDEFTGRMMEGRRFSEGQHQALEAKEGVPIQNENQTLASITFQNYFRLYPKLSGMTGTALTEAAEFDDIYKLGVVEIPTNVPVARIDHDDQIYKSRTEKNAAIVRLIKECQERQQPVLVGTVSIEKSEELSALLKKEQIPHHVLNARYHEQEAFIIAQAGQPGAVTIATNMAGRGTDIQLGGNLDMRIANEIDPALSEGDRNAAIEALRREVEENRKIVHEAGGLYVIGTERHESRRIDNQLRGRSGRQGDPGDTLFFLSLEDDLMRVFGAEKMEMLLNNKQIGLKEGEALVHPWISKALERAQARVEAMHYEIRKTVVKYDDVMNDQRTVIYDQRREVMETDDVSDLMTEMRHDTIYDLVERCIPLGSYAEQWDLDSLKLECEQTLGLDLPVAAWAKEEGIGEKEMEEKIIAASDEKMMEKAATIGAEVFRQMEKSFLLQVLDRQWKEHLLGLDHLRQGINLRAFGQKDPLNEYKTEAFGMFEGMLGQIREEVTRLLATVDAHATVAQLEAVRNAMREQMQAQMDAAKAQHENFQGLSGSENTSMQGGTPNAEGTITPLRYKDADPEDPSTWAKTPRNAPCPCGSGKKYKQCHGKLG